MKTLKLKITTLLLSLALSTPFALQGCVDFGEIYGSDSVESSVPQSNQGSPPDDDSSSVKDSSSIEQSSTPDDDSSSVEDDSSIEQSSTPDDDSSSVEDDSSIEQSSTPDDDSSSVEDDSSIEQSSTPDDESSSVEDDSSVEESSTPDDDSSSVEDDSSIEESSTPDDDSSSENKPEYDEVSIHFLELGNQYTGDCTLIKVGDVEVLIDAGSRKGSAATLVPYIKQYCTDGVLEYVIATHAHQDHIAGFVGESGTKGIFESFVCETIIDYSRSDSTSQIRKSYEQYRAAEVQAGATHYTVLDCWYNRNGAQRSYELGDGVTMNFLYQKYYESSANKENDYSVCMLLSQGDNHYLFTGDLESNGEKSLVQSNELPKCKLYKAGHHGSYTSSTTTLLSVIQPEIVCVCCCCGSSEYTTNVANQFPSQTFVNNVAPYTDKVYVTTLATSKGYTSMNGNIKVYTENGEVKVQCSNNNTLFKDTDWFKKNRTTPNAWK